MQTLSRRSTESSLSTSPSSPLPVFVQHETTQTQVSVLEASGFDLRILSSRAFPVGQIVKVKTLTGFPASEEEFPGVVHFVVSRLGRFEIGIVLVCHVAEELIVISTGGQRVNIRFQCKVPGDVYWTDSATKESATVLNYSRGGICLQTRHRAEPGSSFQLKWNYPVPGTYMKSASGCFSGVVRWSSGSDGSALAGCKLNGALGYLVAGVDLGLMKGFRPVFGR